MAPSTNRGSSREVHEARLPRTCNRPCAFEVKETNEEQNPTRHKKTYPKIYPQQPGDRDHLETACSETRPTRLPLLALFRHRSRVYGNRSCLYSHVCIYSHCCCCCAACVRFGAISYFLASAASSFSGVILVCISGFEVIRWCLTLSFP